MTPQLAWALVLIPAGCLFALGDVVRLVFGGIAAGAAHVASHLRFLAMPFTYALRRAKGFRRIHGAWVKPRLLPSPGTQPRPGAI